MAGAFFFEKVRYSAVSCISRRLLCNMLYFLPFFCETKQFLLTSFPFLVIMTL